eukprot:c7831_g1_i1.p1 GENE.c7831_g1_i1~~c7831_g1_i1.p1  ORF type:complete len:543 (+),score=131.12 c7831_g1_i1:43-1671(+)
MSLPGRVLPPWLSKAGKSTSVSRHIPIVDTPLPAVAPGTKLSTIAIERICKLLPIAYPRVIVLDTETTGFSSEDTIIEIGAVELIGGRPSGLQYHTLIETTRSIHPKATEVHGLTKQLLQGQPTISQVLPNFLNFISSRPSSSYSVAPGPWDSAEGLPSPPFHTALLAHNAKFDVRMLKQEIDRLGLESPEVLNHTFCTQRCFMKVFPGERYSLESACSKFKIGAQRDTHNAVFDAKLTVQLFHQLQLHLQQYTDERWKVIDLRSPQRQDSMSSEGSLEEKLNQSPDSPDSGAPVDEPFSDSGAAVAMDIEPIGVDLAFMYGQNREQQKRFTGRKGKKSSRVDSDISRDLFSEVSGFQTTDRSTEMQFDGNNQIDNNDSNAPAALQRDGDLEDVFTIRDAIDVTNSKDFGKMFDDPRIVSDLAKASVKANDALSDDNLLFELSGRWRDTNTSKSNKQNSNSSASDTPKATDVHANRFSSAQQLQIVEYFSTVSLEELTTLCSPTEASRVIQLRPFYSFQHLCTQLMSTPLSASVRLLYKVKV